MKSRQFESHTAATDYLKSHGELKYWGRVGSNAETCLYTITVKGYKYEVDVDYYTGKAVITVGNGPTDWLYQ